MALSFPKLSWLWLGAIKDKEQAPNNSSANPLTSVTDWGLGMRGEPESLKLQSTKRGDNRKMSSSNKKSKRKWKTREDRAKRIDKEYDVVLVPSDGVCLSGSESEDSDWSIGWLEPHPPDFLSDDEACEDDSFAVLVPCYRHELEDNVEVHSVQFLSAVKSLPNGYSHGGKELMDQWLSSLHNF